jgi:hypothetical protein
MAIFTSLLSLVSPLHCDAPYPWQIGFQDGATPTFEGIVELHDTIFFYLVVISFLVFWMLSVIMIKFSSNKVGIVHKYHNHGVKRPGISTPYTNVSLNGISYSDSRRQYSTTPNVTPNVTFQTDKANPQNYVDVPWSETLAIKRSRLVMASMLQYLASINSPLHGFLVNHPRVIQLTAKDPYPSLKLPTLSDVTSLIAEFSTVVLGTMNPAVISYSTVYAIGSPGDQDFYVGSRIAGSNRAGTHRQQLRRRLRSVNSDISSQSLSSLQQFVVDKGGYHNVMMGSLVIEPSLTQEFGLSSPDYTLGSNEAEILLYFER